jgi:maltooligosyltrehalose trehalohydrolase
MPISLAQVGATGSVDGAGSLQITFGLYLPGVKYNDGFDVIVRIIHEADRFDPSIPPVDEHLNWVGGSEFDRWTNTVTLTPRAGTNYGQEGTYIYRYQLWRTPPGGGRQLVTNWFTNPFARQTDVGMLSVVTCTRAAPPPFPWTDAGWRTPGTDDLFVYELHMEQFNSTFAGIQDRLVYLKSLGVNCIEMMPVTSTQLDFDWGYGPLHYYAPSAACGGVAGLKQLVDACHQNNVAVILDVVYQHVASSFPYYLVYQDIASRTGMTIPSPMINGLGQFGPQIDFSLPFAQQYCLAANRYWLDEYHVDGFRYDQVTDLYSTPTGTDYANLAYETYRYSRGIARFGCAPGVPSKMIQCAEALWKAPDVLRDTYTNAAWQEELFGAAKAIMGGNPSFDTLTNFAHTLDPFYNGRYPSTKTVVDSVDAAVEMPVAPFQYLTSHDKSHLITSAGTMNASDPLSPGDRRYFYRMQPLIIALYTCQGIPMIWEGEEFVDNYHLADRDAARINLRRDMDWSYFYDEYGQPIISLCRTLGALRGANRALRGRQSYYFYQQSLSQNAIIAYQRHAPAANGQPEQYALVMLNFGTAQGEITLPFPAPGNWTERVDQNWRAKVGQPDLTINIAAAGNTARVTVPSNYGYVFII